MRYFLTRFTDSLSSLPLCEGGRKRQPHPVRVINQVIDSLDIDVLKGEGLSALFQIQLIANQKYHFSNHKDHQD